MLATSLFAGIKVYVPERTVKYRMHSQGFTDSQTGTNKYKKYNWELSHHIITSYLLSQKHLNDDLFDLLDHELSYKNEEPHKKLYQIARDREKASKTENKSISLRHRLAKAEARLDLITKSKSWKVTEPLRWIDRKIRLLR